MAETTTALRVAEAVSEQIKSSGVTLVWLCEHTGIPRSTLVRRLNGSTPFDLNELERIASALRLDFIELFPPTDRVAS